MNVILSPSPPAIAGGPPIRPRRIEPRNHVDASTIERIVAVLQEGRLSDWYGGPNGRRFEDAFARYHSSPCAVSVSTGTAALHLAVAAANIGPDDEVILTTMSYVSGASAILQQGARVVLCDIEPTGLTLDPGLIEPLITPKTRAIMVVHIYGYPTDMPRVCEIARKHGLLVIEDCGQSHGGMIDGKLLGTFGDFGCFAFSSPRKNISTGEGGMVIAKEERHALECRRLTNKGKDDGVRTHRRMGYSYVMAEVPALIGMYGLSDLENEVERRRAAARRYDELLKDSGLDVEPEPPGCRHAYFRKIVRLPEEYTRWRDWFVLALRAENVSAVPPHPPIHQIRWFRSTPPFPPGYPWVADDGSMPRRERWNLPVADREMARLFDVETGPGLTEEDAEVSAMGILKVWEYLRRNHKAIAPVELP